MNRPRPLDIRIAEMLRSEQTLRAVFNGIPSPAIVEMCAYAGFDFVIIGVIRGVIRGQVFHNRIQ